MQITDKTGAVITIKKVKEDDDLMITNMSGIVIRMAVDDIRVMGRATQGVRVIRLDKNDDIADVAVVKHVEPEEIVEDQESTTTNGGGAEEEE